MRILITGLAGFLGHHLGEAVLKETDWEIVGLDRLDSTSTYHRLTDIDCWETEKRRVRLVWHDLRAPINEFVSHKIGHVDCVVHLAASTHVDRSIIDPLSFVMDNVVGTAHLLDWARNAQPDCRFLLFSTDEVHGPAAQGTRWRETDRARATNPYAAAKAGAEQLGFAFQNCYDLPVFVSRTMNIVGERQHAEKYVPKVIKAVLHQRRVTIHADKTKTIPGSRFYIHARNVAKAILFLLDHAIPGEVYNIVGEREINNLELAQLIAGFVGMPLQYELVDFHSSRPGHDLRYALDGSKLKAMGFDFPKTLEESLEKTVRWYLDHPEWLEG